MAGIKNKDGSINWSKVKVNPVIDAVWGDAVALNPCKDGVNEIKAFVKKQYENASEKSRCYKECRCYKDYIEYLMCLSRMNICADILDFIDRIIEL